MVYLEELNRLFGAKFTLFIPSNYHNTSPLSKHKDWVDWLIMIILNFGLLVLNSYLAASWCTFCLFHHEGHERVTIPFF